MGNGTIYKRGGAWCVNFTVNGRRVRETVGPNKRVAEKVLSLRMTQVLENRYFPPSRVLGRLPFNEFALMYLDRVIPLMKSIRTERDRVKRWVKDLGARPLGQISRADIESWRRQRMPKLKPSSINRELSRLRHMLNTAVSWKLLDESPMAGMKFQRENNARTRYLSIEECQRLIASCIAPHIRAIVTVALHSGMRLGEILSLRWRDLDFQANFVLVRDSKNGQARHVPMDAMISELLSVYDRRPGSDFVFPNKNGGRLTDIKVGFRNACDRAGITDLHFHDLRHTFASQFMMAGGEIYTLQQILGHKTASMTARYSHLSPAYKVKAIDRMNTVWQRSLPVPSASEGLLEPSVVTTASQPTLSPPPTSQESFPGAGLSASEAGAPAD